jgi:hypothetical protein
LRNQAPLLRILKLRECVLLAAMDEMSLEDMQDHLDKLQLALNLVHNEIFRTWFQIRYPAPRKAAATTVHA